MGIGAPGDHGDSALGAVVEVFSSPIVTVITQHLETMDDIAQESGPSTAHVTSCPVLPMVCFLLIKPVSSTFISWYFSFVYIHFI